jgi:HEAT repeat protein
LAPSLSAQTAPPTDPVEELRRDLRQPIDPTNKAALKHRKELLEKHIDSLKTLSDLRRALAITPGWRDMPGQPPEIREIDEAARKAIGEKFKKGANAVIKTGGVDARVALADMLGEMGPEIRSLIPEDTAGFGRAMAPELVELTRDKTPAVRAAAAQALGKVFPVPETAAKALKEVLESGTAEERRGAAQGLVNLIQVVSALEKTGRSQTGVEAKGPDVLEAARRIIEVAKPGLTYSDPRVRALTLDAVLKSLNAFREQIKEPDPKLPPTGRPLSPFERKVIDEARAAVDAEQKLYQPVVKAILAQRQPLARLMDDPDPKVRLEARKALEAVGDARLRIRRLVASVAAFPAQGVAAPLVPAAQKVEEGKEDWLAEALKPGLNIVARGLRDPDPKIRLVTVEFLESLEDAAEPAVPVLVEALGDKNRFVRWAAARAFSKIGPDQLGVVPGLASLLRDPDVDVAKQAATTLGGYADKAAAAVPALAQAAALADPEVRVASMTALGGMPPAAAAAAVPALVTALTNRDAEVRRVAAETLGKLGPRARDAVPPLRVAVRDDNPNVRRAASDAILSILAPVAK